MPKCPERPSNFLILVVVCWYVKVEEPMTTIYLDAFLGPKWRYDRGAPCSTPGPILRASKQAVAGLGLRGYRLSTRRKNVSAISALKFDVEVNEPQPERHVSEIRAMIEGAALPPAVTHMRLRSSRP